jgi:hypothetical protein
MKQVDGRYTSAFSPCWGLDPRVLKDADRLLRSSQSWRIRDVVMLETEANWIVRKLRRGDTLWMAASRLHSSKSVLSAEERQRAAPTVRFRISSYEHVRLARRRLNRTLDQIARMLRISRKTYLKRETSEPRETLMKLRAAFPRHRI